MESGGYATAWSMRFQNLWAVRQLLLLLADELRAVRIEPAGLEGEGVDVIVTLPDGRSEYQQCKRSFRHAGKWTLRALEAERVLSTIGDRLRMDRGGTFRLVSVDSAPGLRDLADCARASLDPTSFYEDQINASAVRATAFKQFCSPLQLDPARTESLAEAQDLLRRTFTEVVGDDEGALRDLQSTARYWVDGRPELVISALESFAQGTLRRAITGADIEAFLQSRGFHPRVLARDPRILPAIKQLHESFEMSLSTQLLRGRLLKPRSERPQRSNLARDYSQQCHCSPRRTLVPKVP